MTLIQVDIRTRSGNPASVTGEQVSANFALTPAIRDLEDGTSGIAESLCLTHVPTGLRVSWSVWLDLRTLAAKLEELPIDWSSAELRLTPGQSALAQAVVREAEMAYRTADASDSLPGWLGDASTPALSLLGTVLDAELHGFERFGTGQDLAKEVAAVNAELGAKVDAEMLWRTAAANTSGYGTAFLLAVLHRIDPAAADRAARDLANAWEAGDSLGEWIHQWREELSQGIPLRLHGFADFNTNIEEPTRQFVRYTERNDHEGETWTFWLQSDGNEKPLRWLADFLTDVNAEELDPEHELFLDDVLPEDHVDVLARWGGEAYMPLHNKVIGTMTIPEKFAPGDLYKGDVAELFAVVSDGE